MKQFIAATLVILSAGSAAAMNRDAVPGVLEQAVDGFIRPGYQNFAAATGTLSEAVEAFCAAPDETSYQAATAAFDETVAAWSAIEIVRTSPVLEDHVFPERTKIADGVRAVMEAA